mmetsp:Transcript_8579/g.19249  ORF Transcript_8579/g.19249 Transcript_8579/m.19249 type:complete len:244 (+) Transcript_8579:61-792(+)
MASVAVAATVGRDPVPDPPKKLTQKERRNQICLFLSKRVTKDDKLENGALDDAAEIFNCKKRCVRGVWTKYKNAIVYPDKYKLDVSRKKGTGNKPKFTAAQVQAAVSGVPCRYRHSIRSLAAKVGIPKSTLHRHLKQGDSARSTVREEAAVEEEIQGQNAQTSDVQLSKLREDLKEYYEKEKTRAVEEAKREAQQEHNRHMEKLRGELQQQFHNERDKALYQLRVEMHRHQLELNRLKAELEK